MSSARFKIRNQTTAGAFSLFADEGFDCAPGDVLELQLEDSPALDVWQTIFSCVDLSKNRSVPVFDPVSGEAATPTSIVEVTMPAEYGSWEIQCQVNGGVDALDASGRPDSTINTKTRIVAIRTAVLQLRHPLASEFTVAEPYDTARAAGTMQEAIDALEAGAGAGGASAAGLYLTDALAAINAGDRPIRGLASTLNFSGTSAVVPASFAYYRAKGAFGAALKLYRTILGGTGAPDTSTGADLQWWIPNDDVSPTLTEQVRFRPVLTTIAGANLTSDLGLWLVDGGTLTQRFTWHADGSVTWSAYNTAGGRFIVDGSGNITLAAITEAEARTALAAAAGDVDVNGQKITGLAAGGASGEAVEYDQLNTALGGYVPTSRTITAGAGLTGGGDLSADRTLDVAAADASITVNANSIEASGAFVAKNISTTGSITAGASGFIGPQINRASAGTFLFDSNVTTIDTTARINARRYISAPDKPTSAANAVTFDLSVSQNIQHSTTENTTVSFSGAVEGMSGYIEFIQGGTGYTVTMPTNGTGVEYSDTIAALTTTGIVDTGTSKRTVLRYHVTAAPATRVVIYFRDVGSIP